MLKVEQLQAQLASKILEQDSMKITEEKLQKEKELQDKQMKDMRNLMDNMFDEMVTMTQNAMMMIIRQHPELERLKSDAFEPKKIGNTTYLMPRYSLLSDNLKNQSEFSA